jgi:hypothetical protein
MSIRRHGSIVASVLVLAPLAALAGPLDPPAGPISSTLKPLTEVEPRLALNQVYTGGDFDSVFKITQPGSYYLAADLNGVAGKFGIEVSLVAPGAVTIDLNGFSVRGVTGALSGITNTGFAVLHVRNGTVSGWPGIGVDGAQTADRLTVVGNGTAGIYAEAAAIVTHSIVAGNGANGGYGIDAGPGSIVSDCVVQFNGGAAGGGGIAAGDNSSVRRCIVTGNATTLTGAAGYGIEIGYDADVSECRVDNNGSSGAAASGGVSAGDGTSVTSCRLYGNIGVGIRSGGEGIIAGNAVGGSTGPGITIAGNRARVEGNHLFSNTSGLRVEGTGCTIVRNSVKGATPYSIASGNDTGPVGTAASATSPWANIAN